LICTDCLFLFTYGGDILTEIWPPDTSPQPHTSRMHASRDNPELLKPSEVTARLRVSRTWIYEAAKAGLIPHIRLPSSAPSGQGGPLRFIPEDIDTWITEARANWTPGRQHNHPDTPTQDNANQDTLPQTKRRSTT
jgi:predicted DNA-binding transcriptional regulator AlpA